MMGCVSVNALPPANSENLSSFITQEFAPPPTFRSEKKEPIMAAPQVEGPTASPLHGIVFPLKDIEIQGDKTLLGPDLEDTLNAYRGKEASFQMLKDLAKDLTRLCRGQGYVFSQVVLSPQKITGGKVVFRVIPGFVESVVFTGDLDLVNDRIRRVAARFTSENPLHQDTMERTTQLLANLSGVKSNVTFSPSKTVQGASVATVHLSHNDLNGYANINNDGSRQVGPVYGAAGFSVNNLLNENAQLDVNGGLSLSDQNLQLYGAGLTIPVFDNGLAFNVNAKSTITTPEGNLSSYGMHNDYHLLSVGLSYPLILKFYSRLDMGLSFETVENRVEYRALGTLQQDKTRVVEPSLSYDFSDSFAGQNLVRFALRQGIDGMGSTPDSSTTKTRQFGHMGFSNFTFLARRLQSLDKNFAVLLNIAGQAAGTSLPASERFQMGGVNDRGYLNAGIAGDSGVQGRLELQFRPDSEDKPTLFYVYLTQEFTWNRQPAADENACFSAGGGGVGISQPIFKEVEVYTEYSYPFKKSVASGALNGALFVGIRTIF